MSCNFSAIQHDRIAAKVDINSHLWTSRFVGVHEQNFNKNVLGNFVKFWNIFKNIFCNYFWQNLKELLTGEEGGLDSFLWGPSFRATKVLQHQGPVLAIDGCNIEFSMLVLDHTYAGNTLEAKGSRGMAWQPLLG